MAWQWRRLVGLLTIISMLGVLLAACGSSSETQGGTTQGGDTNTGAATSPTAAPAGDTSSGAAAGGGEAAATPATGGETAAAGQCPDTAQGQQITMWSPLTGPDGDEMTALANQFSQENAQGITVQHIAQPEYLQKLNTAAAGGSLPDMTVIRTYDMPEMALRNVVKPISDDAMAIIGTDLEGDFPEAVWNAGEFRDQRYMVPLDVHPLVLYYNKDMFEQAGITMPTDRPMNKEEFESAVQALNKDGVAGIALGTAFQSSTLFQTLIRQFGGQLANEEGTEATYNSDEGVQALTYLRDLKQQNTPDVNGAGDPEVKLFQQQRAAMVMHGPWHISDMQKLPFVGFAQLPQIGDTYSVWGNSHQLALTAEDPAKQAAAACWINWLSANSVQWAKAGQIPARTSVREGGDLQSVAPAVAGFAAEAEHVHFLPQVPGIENALWGQGFEPAVNDILLGKQQDIKAALDAAAAKSNQLLEQNAQKYQ